jgi:bifunctional ADP-heptose synthase (sugar kinase/adenylyltransferase)
MVTKKEVIESKIVRAGPGKVVTIDFLEGDSTIAIIEKLRHDK